jgi:hypothetical protein
MSQTLVCGSGAPELAAGEIGKLRGLGESRIGDTIGQPPATAAQHHFAPPTLETIVAPMRPSDDGALRGALARLAEQDLQRQLPGLTAGEGVLESTFDGYRPARGDPPTRPRTTADPRHREEYLISLTRHGARG